MEERLWFEVVLLKVDTGEAIDLEIDERRGEPGQVGDGSGWGGVETGEAGGIPGDLDHLSGGVKPGHEGRHGGMVWWGRSGGQDL